MGDTKTEIEQLALDIAERSARAQALASDIQQLAAQVDRLRKVGGTRDLAADTQPATRARSRTATIAPAIVNEAPAESTPDLYQAIERYITEEPRTFRAIKAQFPVTDNRIKSVLIRLQRDGRGVANLGNSARAIWFIPSPEAIDRIAKLRRER